MKCECGHSEVDHVCSDPGNPTAVMFRPCYECGCLDFIPRSSSQALFEAMFPAGHIPKIDTRTPKDVAAQAAREGWK